jgi:hypothetical protein
MVPRGLTGTARFGDGTYEDAHRDVIRYPTDWKVR